MTDWKIGRPMTALQAMALGDIIDKGGRLVRHQGGYWTLPGAVKTAVIGHPFDWWVGTSTVEGLVRRGELEYVDWRDGRDGRFPIAVAIPSSSSTALKGT